MPGGDSSAPFPGGGANVWCSAANCRQNEREDERNLPGAYDIPEVTEVREPGPLGLDRVPRLCLSSTLLSIGVIKFRIGDFGFRIENTNTQFKNYIGILPSAFPNPQSICSITPTNDHMWERHSKPPMGAAQSLVLPRTAGSSMGPDSLLLPELHKDRRL